MARAPIHTSFISWSTLSRSRWSAIREKRLSSTFRIPGNLKCSVVLTERPYYIKEKKSSFHKIHNHLFLSLCEKESGAAPERSVATANKL
ncbi:MAG: hypothetical protein A4E57_01369 [Syntrophorhabdaceae bacterium PtaU1.Bin034]|nr:MAG: hypothetical protein A4E57_01369 [Syntrophorhabdaceae bacterium PtaU1.Bin034]